MVSRLSNDVINLRTFLVCYFKVKKSIFKINTKGSLFAIYSIILLSIINIMRLNYLIIFYKNYYFCLNSNII